MGVESGVIMGSGLRRLILVLLLLSLTALGSGYGGTKTAFQYNELPLQQQIAISRGSEGIRPEMTFQNIGTEETEITVMTFNICHGVNQNGEESLDPLIESIRATDANIIGLQEVDRFMPRSKFKDQAKEIAAGLGYNYVYGETINILGIQYGNAILSQFPIIEHENKKLPGDSIESRALLRVKIDVAGNPLEVYTTHLGLTTSDRRQQIKSINSSLEQSVDPFILMGDFNAEPHNEEMSQLSPIVADIAVTLRKEDLYTYAFYNDTPNTRIDRIYASQNIGILDHYVLESFISDHSMVFGVFSINSIGKEGLMAYAGNNNK